MKNQTVSITLKNIYKVLYKSYGPQGWWPLIKYKKISYNPGQYVVPKNKIFEICVGAILTQNTNWKNVEKAIINLNSHKLLNPQKILSCNPEVLLEAIRPSGYFNQKAKKLLIFSSFLNSLKTETPTRENLLNLWGIGPETADSILLYAYQKPYFIVDSYTKRILQNLKLVKKEAKYDDIQELFQQNLKNDYTLFQEFHALLVAHAKLHYSNKPYGKECNLKKLI